MTSSRRVAWSEGMFLRPQHFQQQERFLETLIERRTMIVSLDLPAQSRCFVLTGKVLRRDTGHFVIALNGKLKDGQVRDFELIDAFDLKATLLQHPATLA